MTDEEKKELPVIEVDGKEAIPYFVVAYRLFEKDGDGKLVPFEKTRSLYTANITAKTADEAIEELKEDFHMMTVEVLSVSSQKTMTLEEYENGDEES